MDYSVSMYGDKPVIKKQLLRQNKFTCYDCRGFIYKFINRLYYNQYLEGDGIWRI